MEETVYALLRLGDAAPERLRRLSEKMRRVACYAFGDTRRQLEAVLKISEQKRLIENQLYYREKLLKGLTDEEAELLMLRARGVPSERAKEGRGYSGTGSRGAASSEARCPVSS